MGFLRAIGLGSLPDVVVLDETSLDVVAELDAGGHDGRIAGGPDSVWFINRSGRKIGRIDPLTCAVTVQARLPERPWQIAVDAHGPVVLSEDHTLIRVDPTTGAVRAQVPAPEIVEVAVGTGSVWALRAAGFWPAAVSIQRLDPHTLAVQSEWEAGTNHYPGLLVVEDGAVATSVEDPPGSLAPVVFDVRTGERLDPARAPDARGIAGHNGHVWRTKGKSAIERITRDGADVLARAKLKDMEVADVTRAHGHLWVTTNRGGTFDAVANGES